MCPTITKYEVKKFTKLGKKHGKTLSNYLKRPIDDAIEHSTKRVTPIKNYKQPMKMTHARPTPPKEKEVYELSNDGIFS